MSKSDTRYHKLPDYGSLVEKLYDVRSSVDSDYGELCALIPKCRWNDARLTAIGHIGQLIDSTILVHTFINRHLLPIDSSWWKEVYKVPFPEFTEYHRSVAINNLTVGFAKVAFIQNLFSIIDSSFRIFLRALKPEAEPPINFNKVYTKLKKELKSIGDDSDQLLKLLSLTRNTIHNNGVYFFGQGVSTSVDYKGRSYEFNYGMPIKFVTWEWLIERIADVLQLMSLVVRNPKLITTEYIPDPFSTRNRAKL
jgi:hypothetical protein